MRFRLSILSAVSLLGALALAVPGIATAASHGHRYYHHPRHNRGLTITSTPNPITAGEGVLIYGELKGPDNADQTIMLFHRVNTAPYFTLIGTTHTNATGYYEFVRAEGVVVSNRNWYVLGPNGTHSRTIHEWVASLLTLSESSSTSTANKPVQFTGTVFPDHPYQRVLLQEQNSTAGNGWQTIASGYTGAGSAFTIDHTFRTPGSYTLRAFLRADARNTAGQSSPVTLTVEQTQNTSFTINGSAPVITDGQPETITGTLYTTGSTTAPDANAQVTLYGKRANGAFMVLATMSTNLSGGYTFMQVPLHNMVYKVETANSPVRSTANLFIGVQDVVTITPSALTVLVGNSITFTGTVAPDHFGHVINLQRETTSGHWVDVESSYLTASSTYSFTYPFSEPGAATLRAEVPGGPVNLGGVSSSVTITASGLAAVNTLPPAS